MPKISDHPEGSEGAKKSASGLGKLLIGTSLWPRVLRSILLAYLGFMAFAWFGADNIIFSPQVARYRDTSKFLKIPVTATEKITAISLINPQATYTVLYSHGQSEDLGDSNTLRMIDRIHKSGFNVLAYDYRGHGTSDGSVSEQNAYQDVDAAYRYLTEQLKVPANKIIVYGRSLGGAMAIDLASKRPVAGLVVESSFTSAFRVVVPFPVLPFEKFNSIAKLAKIRCPVLIMHGDADGTIPFSHGQQLYAAAPNPKRHLWVHGAGHTDLEDIADKAYDSALQDFQKLLCSMFKFSK
jgi:abhydrolase domain-containing protein 17